MLSRDGVVTTIGDRSSEAGVASIDEAIAVEDQLIVKRLRVDIDVPGINSYRIFEFISLSPFNQISAGETD